MKLADIQLTIPLPDSKDDLYYNGFVHPQINQASLLDVIVQQFSITHSTTYNVLVDGPSPAGPYTFDVQPTGEDIEQEDEDA